MPSLDDVVRHHTRLDDDDLEWLRMLVSDWQLLADLSFADLVLWLPDQDGHGFWAGAQMRPTTGPTAYVDDLVGSFVPRGRRPLLENAYDEGRICREGDPEWRDDVPVRVETVPVRRGERVIGVVARNTNLLSVRTPSRLELTYLQSATDLAVMISDGGFPVAGERSDLGSIPRVGDGLARLDPEGIVTYASPNAQSAYRRLGNTRDLVGERLGPLTAALVPPPSRPVEESLETQISGRAPRETEVENGLATLVIRVIPLVPGGRPIGALVLLREITDLRRRERELLTKEATIKEIHHRVKNNLQTVAALLRLQARRLDAGAGRYALEEAVRRVSTIAVVHETLSEGTEEWVDFDEMVDRVLAMVLDVVVPADDPSRRVTCVRDGSFGTLDTMLATPLAMALTEALLNAVQHGLGGGAGRVVVRAERPDGKLRVIVDDDGAGLPPGFDPYRSTSLGLQIMRTLVESELGGRLEIVPGEERGTRVLIDLSDVDH